MTKALLGLFTSSFLMFFFIIGRKKKFYDSCDGLEATRIDRNSLKLTDNNPRGSFLSALSIFDLFHATLTLFSVCLRNDEWEMEIN